MILGILNHNCSSSVNSRMFILVYIYFLVVNFMLVLCICNIKLWYILCYTTAFYRNRISTHVVELLFWWSLPRTNKTMFLFWNLWPSTVIQGFSDNRYFTAVGFFLRDLNTKHWLWLSANKTKVQILCGMNLDAEDWDVHSQLPS